MAIGDILATVTDTINIKEFTIRARPEYTTSLDDPSVASKYPGIIAALQELRKFPQFAKYGTSDEIFEAIFGPTGINLNGSIIDTPLTTTSSGDLQDLTPTINSRFIGVINITNTDILNFDIQMLTTSYIADFFSLGRDYLASLPLWGITIQRNTTYANLKEANPELAQGGSKGYRATAEMYERMRSESSRLDMSDKLVIGKLTNADTGTRLAANSLQTGTLSFKGKIAHTYKNVSI